MSRTHGMIEQALDKIDNIRSIKETVMANQYFHGVETQFSKAENYLKAIKSINGLKMHDFSIEVEAAIEILQKCESIFGKLPSSSMDPSRLTPGQLGDERQLRPMQGILDEALQKISSRVLNTPVGLTEDYHVKYGVLYETNDKVNEVFGNNLALVDFLEKESLIDKKDTYGNINLGAAKFEAFKLSVSQKSGSGTAAQTPSNEKITERYDRAVIRGNTTGHRMTTVTGHLGFEPGYEAPYAGTSQFVDNKLGDDGALFTGDIRGPAAAEIISQIFENRVRREQSEELFRA